MRLIDADALIDNIPQADLNNDKKISKCGAIADMVLLVCDAPTIDAVPVVRGEWMMDTDPDDGDCRCSNCLVCIDALHRRNHDVLNALGYKLHTFYKYCPNCGARMEAAPC